MEYEKLQEKKNFFGTDVMMHYIFRSTHFTAGPGMNNSITLSKHHNGVRVTVCNNDQSVCIMSVPNMEKITTLRMPAAINHGKWGYMKQEEQGELTW